MSRCIKSMVVAVLEKELMHHHWGGFVFCVFVFLLAKKPASVGTLDCELLSCVVFYDHSRPIQRY